MHRFAALSAALLLAACSQSAPVEPSLAGAAAVTPQRVRQVPAVFHLEPELRTLSRDVRPTSFQCSAHGFPLAAGEAIEASIRQTMRAGFPNAAPAEAEGGAPEGGYRIAFALETFQPRLRVEPGFWSNTASASAELAVMVEVQNAEGELVYRGLVLGTGAEEMRGDCREAGIALGRATSTAIRRMNLDFVAKVLNGPAFR